MDRNGSIMVTSTALCFLHIEVDHTYYDGGIRILTGARLESKYPNKMTLQNTAGRPIVALDADGVLLDYHAGYRDA
jgi:hypothetical protein